MKSETKTLSVPFDTPKSLFRNILHITLLNPKIWIVLACNGNKRVDAHVHWMGRDRATKR